MSEAMRRLRRAWHVLRGRPILYGVTITDGGVYIGAHDHGVLIENCYFRTTLPSAIPPKGLDKKRRWLRAAQRWQRETAAVRIGGDR